MDYYETARDLLEGVCEEAERDFDEFLQACGVDPNKFELPPDGLDFTVEDIQALAEILQKHWGDEPDYEEIPDEAEDFLVNFVFEQLIEK